MAEVLLRSEIAFQNQRTPVPPGFISPSTRRKRLPPAAQNEGGGQVQPDDRAFRNRVEIRRQSRREFPCRRQAHGMDVAKRYKASAGFQDVHHLVENRDLQRGRKRGPRQTRNNAIDRTDPGAIANLPRIGDAIFEQGHARITNPELRCKPGIQFDGGKLRARTKSAKYVFGERTGSRTILEHRFGALKVQTLNHCPRKTGRTWRNRSDRRGIRDELLEEFHGRRL